MLERIEVGKFVEREKKASMQVIFAVLLIVRFKRECLSGSE